MLWLSLIEHSLKKIKFWKICTSYILFWYPFDILFGKFLFSNVRVEFLHLYSIINWLFIEKILKNWAPLTRKEYQLKSFLWHINQCRWKSRICLVVKWFSEWPSKSCECSSLIHLTFFGEKIFIDVPMLPIWFYFISI